eukprot:scaffold79255_cov19-Tisochrysis_lutea.AAC.2
MDFPSSLMLPAVNVNARFPPLLQPPPPSRHPCARSSCTPQPCASSGVGLLVKCTCLTQEHHGQRSNPARGCHLRLLSHSPLPPTAQ